MDLLATDSERLSEKPSGETPRLVNTLLEGALVNKKFPGPEEDEAEGGRGILFLNNFVVSGFTIVA